MGRLIDEDSVKRRMHETMDYQDLYLPVHFEMCMNDVPTVKPASPWHRVEEELPKEYGNYIAVVNGEVMEVTYSDRRDDWKWSTCDADGFVWIRSELVTHWMQLPEPPKEDA